MRAKRSDIGGTSSDRDEVVVEARAMVIRSANSAMLGGTGGELGVWLCDAFGALSVDGEDFGRHEL